MPVFAPVTGEYREPLGEPGSNAISTRVTGSDIEQSPQIMPRGGPGKQSPVQPRKADFGAQFMIRADSPQP